MPRLYFPKSQFSKSRPYFPKYLVIWSYFPNSTTFTGASWFISMNELLCCAAGAGKFGILTTKKGGNAWFLAVFNTLKPGFRPPLAAQSLVSRNPDLICRNLRFSLFAEKHNQISLICRNPWPPPPQGGCPLYSEGARFQKNRQISRMTKAYQDPTGVRQHITVIYTSIYISRGVPPGSRRPRSGYGTMRRGNGFRNPILFGTKTHSNPETIILQHQWRNATRSTGSWNGMF